MQAAAAAGAAAVAAPWVVQDIQAALANESATKLSINLHIDFAESGDDPPPLTVYDGQSIMECLRENPHRFDTLSIVQYPLHDADFLIAFRDGLPLCTSVTTVTLFGTQMGNEVLERLLPAFHNTSVTSLDIKGNNIEGQRGGQALRDLLLGNKTLFHLSLAKNHIGPEGTSAFGHGLIIGNHHLQALDLQSCNIRNEGLERLVVAAMEQGENCTGNTSLTHLSLCSNRIEGAEGGRLVCLLLQRCFPALKVLILHGNNLGPLGAHAMSPILVAASCQLEWLGLDSCGLGNDGVDNLIPDGRVNRSLTNLDLRNDHQDDLASGENILALASRCTNLDCLALDSLYLDDVIALSPDQQRRLDLLLERKHLYTQAQALGGSPLSVVFQKLLQANAHEHGLSASFVILRDYIFAEQQKSSSSTTNGEQKEQGAATGVKRKR